MEALRLCLSNLRESLSAGQPGNAEILNQIDRLSTQLGTVNSVSASQLSTLHEIVWELHRSGQSALAMDLVSQLMRLGLLDKPPFARSALATALAVLPFPRDNFVHLLDYLFHDPQLVAEHRDLLSKLHKLRQKIAGKSYRYRIANYHERLTEDDARLVRRLASALSHMGGHECDVESLVHFANG